MFELSYQMHIAFDHPIRDHHFMLRLLPRAMSGLVVHRQLLMVSGDHDYGRLMDGFSNRLITGVLTEAHQQFEAQYSARIGRVPTHGSSRLLPSVFLPQSQLTYADPCLFDAELSGISLPQNAYQRALRLSEWVHERMTYTSGSTDIGHSVRELLQRPFGVCQDYAHLLIALLRHHHIPARYVAGITQGEGQTHAWVEAWIDEQWQGFDPTHQQIITPNDPYIAFAIGRDFNDCPLNSGCFVGQSVQKMTIQAHLSSC